MIKAIKQLTVHKPDMCTGYLFDSSGKKCCITGAFYRACGVPKARMIGQQTLSSKNEEIAEAFNVKRNVIDSLISNAMDINDKKRDSWKRRFQGIAKLFKEIGVKIIYKE